MVLPTLIVAVSSIDTPSLIIVPLMSIGGGIILTADNSLVLEQAPRLLVTMMSTNYAASQLGTALKAGAGGLALHLLGWGAVGFSLGAMKILVNLVYRHSVKDTGHSMHTSMGQRARERRLTESRP